MVRRIWNFVSEVVEVTLWVIAGVAVLIAVGILIAFSVGVELTPKDVTLDIIGQLASIIAGTVAIVIATRHQGRKETVAAGREIYQQLELASIDLFRFEADHTKLTRPLWEAGAKLPDKGTAEENAFHNYVCQNLNLHEMAIRFRLDKIMDAPIFASWIAWFWTLSKAPRFPEIWEELKGNYIIELQHTYNKGIKIASGGGGDEEKYQQFQDWLESRLEKETLGEPAEDNCEVSSLLSRSCHVEPPPTPDIAWESNPAAAQELAQFFALEVKLTPEYISHGEVQIGRAKDFDHWNYGLDSCLELEFREILTQSADKDCAARIVVARVKNELGAVAVVRFISGKPKYAVLEDLVVKSTLRGQGVGRKVVLWVEAEAKTQEASHLFLESGAGNTEAHDFFLQLDFRRCSFVMVKSLP